ncbi:MAG: ATPase domain-containing protein [Nitrososphaerota archaeon]
MLERKLSPTGIDELDKVIGGFPKGGLITISGNPGTGKTALASTFIYNGVVKYGEPGVYASLLEEEEKFYEFMMSFGLDFKSLRNRGVFRYIPIPTLLEPGMSMSVADIVEMVDSIGARRLVIDSFTAMSQMFKSQTEARIFLHTLLSKIARQLECTTLLIKEVSGKDPEYGFEEFISDGVLFLKRRYYAGRLLRELHILKMRGVEVFEPKLCISLHDGFKVLRPLRIGVEHIQRKYVPPPDPKGRYTTGIQDLDKVIGGYPKASTVIYEIDPRLTILDYELVLMPLLVSYTLRERGIITLPSGGIGWQHITELYKTFSISHEHISRYLRILIDADLGEKKTLPSYVHQINVASSEDLVNMIREFTNNFITEYREPPVIVIGVDRLIYRLKENAIGVIYSLTNLVKATGGLVIWIVKPVYPWSVKAIAPLADHHLKITRINGRLTLYGIKPRTPLYAIELVNDGTFIKLVPIM